MREPPKLYGGMRMNDYIGYILTGGIAAGLIKLLDNLIQWILNRKAAQKDNTAHTKQKTEAEKEQELDEIKEAVKSLSAGQMTILHDRIKYLGKGYVRAGKIAIDDREDIVKMHEVYHRLGGNGNLNALMSEILGLPLRHD